MSVFNPTSVLNQFHAMLASITTEASPHRGFIRSPYGVTLDKEPVGGVDGMYEIDLARVSPYSRKWGTGENIAEGNVTVRVAYFRGMGDAGGGDRLSVRRSAGDDAQLIADVCENPDNYGSSESGISVVVFDGFSRVADLPKCEIWETRFSVQWRSDLHTDPVLDLMVANFVCDTVAVLSAVSVVSMSTGATAFVIGGASRDVWSYYTLDRDSVATADGSTVVEATGGGNWLIVSTGTSDANAGPPSQVYFDLPNSDGDNVEAAQELTELYDRTPTAEIASKLIRLMYLGARVAAQEITGLQTKFPDGTTTAPGVAFYDGSVGVGYNRSLGRLQLSIGGAAHQINAGGLLIDSGNADFIIGFNKSVIHMFWYDSAMAGVRMRGGLFDGVDVKASGVRIHGQGTTGEVIAAGLAVKYNSSGAVVRADKTTGAGPCEGITQAGAGNGAAIDWVKSGIVTGCLTGQTIGSRQYLSTAGTITSTVNSTSGSANVMLGIAVSATDLDVQISDRGVTP